MAIKLQIYIWDSETVEARGYEAEIAEEKDIERGKVTLLKAIYSNLPDEKLEKVKSIYYTSDTTEKLRKEVYFYGIIDNETPSESTPEFLGKVSCMDNAFINGEVKQKPMIFWVLELLVQDSRKTLTQSELHLYIILKRKQQREIETMGEKIIITIENKKVYGDCQIGLDLNNRLKNFGASKVLLNFRKMEFIDNFLVESASQGETNDEAISQITFSECVFKQNCVISPFRARDCYMDIVFNMSTIQSALTFRGGNFYGRVLIDGGKINQICFSEKNKFHKEITIGAFDSSNDSTKPQIKGLSINEGEFNGRFIISEAHIGSMLIEQAYFSDLQINQSQIDALYFSKIRRDARIAVRGKGMAKENSAYVGGLSLQMLNPMESFICSGIRIGSMEIGESSLGGARFTGINFEDTEISVSNSDISNIQFLNSQLPNKLLLKEVDTAESYQQQRDTYRQFKIVMLNSHDQVMANVYSASEMEYYYKYLSKVCGMKKIWHPDWLILWTSEKASDFGLNWWKAIKMWFVVNTMLLFFAKGYLNRVPELMEDISTGKWDFYTVFESFCDAVGSSEFWESIGTLLFEIFFPFQFVIGKKDSVPNLAEFIMVITTIVFGYQALKAFRKFSRK